MVILVGQHAVESIVVHRPVKSEFVYSLVSTLALYLALNTTTPTQACTIDIDIAHSQSTRRKRKNLHTLIQIQRHFLPYKIYKRILLDNISKQLDPYALCRFHPQPASAQESTLRGLHGTPSVAVRVADHNPCPHYQSGDNLHRY